MDINRNEGFDFIRSAFDAIDQIRFVREKATIVVTVKRYMGFILKSSVDDYSWRNGY